MCMAEVEIGAHPQCSKCDKPLEIQDPFHELDKAMSVAAHVELRWYDELRGMDPVQTPSLIAWRVAVTRHAAVAADQCSARAKEYWTPHEDVDNRIRTAMRSLIRLTRWEKIATSPLEHIETLNAARDALRVLAYLSRQNI